MARRTTTKTARLMQAMIMMRLVFAPVVSSRSVLCPDGGVCVEVAGPGSNVEVVVTIGLLERTLQYLYHSLI